MKKIIFLSLVSFVIFLTVGYFYCCANTLELDYRITELKTQISTLEEENNKLKESVSIIKDPVQVKKWAENNSFIEVTKVEYFNLNVEKTIVKK